jgi:hypothetical protein
MIKATMRQYGVALSEQNYSLSAGGVLRRSRYVHFCTFLAGTKSPLPPDVWRGQMVVEWGTHGDSQRLFHPSGDDSS